MLEDQLSAKHRKRLNRKRRLWIAASAITTVLVIVGVLWFLFRSPFWRIRAVTVRGNSAVAAAEIKDMITSGIHSMLGVDNLLAWPSGALPASETALIPQLATASVSKNYFGHSVTVT